MLSRHKSAATDRPSHAGEPLVLFVEPRDGRHAHSACVASAGFRVVSVASEDVDMGCVLEHAPAVVAAEVDEAGATTLDLARRFRQIPDARLIPFIIYGHELRPHDIEETARAGVLWLQLEPTDGSRLIAAIRGLIAASRKNCG